MSKAFTKEQDSDDDDGAETESASLLPPGSKNYMTPAGAEALRAELKVLLYESRPEVVKTVSWAASNGDRSENGDYIYGKKRLREIDRRIRFLTKRLESAEVVDPRSQPTDRVLFGAQVTVQMESGESKTYQIVGIDEAQPASGKISWISPLAKSLLGSRIGDAVIFKSPKGEEELEIIQIIYG